MIPLLSSRRAPQLDRKDRNKADHGVYQAKQRTRRRQHLNVTLGEHWDLLVEVFDIARPLADRITSEPAPHIFWADVDELTSAVHRLVIVVADLITTADARRRTAHLPLTERDLAVQALRDLAEKPQLPAITDGMLSSGLWVQALTDCAGPYSGTLSTLLASAAAPGTRRGLLSVSEQVIDALREVDRAATSLTVHLDRTAFNRGALRRTPKTGKPDPRATLAALGIDLEGTTS